eukprot:4524107-Pleurochrysis_carterae.AAC.1
MRHAPFSRTFIVDSAMETMSMVPTGRSASVHALCAPHVYILPFRSTSMTASSTTKVVRIPAVGNAQRVVA